MLMLLMLAYGYLEYSERSNELIVNELSAAPPRAGFFIAPNGTWAAAPPDAGQNPSMLRCIPDPRKYLVKSGGDGWLFGEPRQLVCHFKADTSSADPERVQSSPINGFGLALRGDRSSIRLTSPVP